VKVYDCKTIEEAIAKGMEIVTLWGKSENDMTTDVWFRGVPDNELELQPSAYWKKADENSTFVSFKQIVPTMVDTKTFDSWDFYCLARHHGIPTRLLDWSEGLLKAIFFAFDKWDGKTTPCIWVLRPHLLNKNVIKDGSIFSPNSHDDEVAGALKLWLPPIINGSKTVAGVEWKNDHPIAIYPSRSNSRIGDQLGTFTVHGVNEEPLEKYISKLPDPDDILIRINLIGFDVEGVKRQLWYMGLRQSTIYSDPDHLAKDVCYAYGCN